MSTPLRAQYLRLKQPFPDALLLFRLGDFYEVYGRDATIAARELGLTLCAREFAGGERVQVCPFPYHAAEGHIKRLVARGYKVAIAEQIGDPRITTGLVAREVVRVVTPTSAIKVHPCLPFGHVAGPLGAEPDRSGISPSRREMSTTVTSTDVPPSSVAPISPLNTSEEEWRTAPAVQLTLFDLPVDGNGTGW